MKRVAFSMKIKKGCGAEYKKRHDEIWPELEEVIRKAGISDYSIYLDEETLSLFAFHKHDENNNFPDLAENPIVRKWWNYMADIMEVNPDNSPVVTSLKEVFHID